MNAHKAIRSRLVCLIIVVLILASLIPIGVALAQSGEKIRLTTVASPAGEGVSSGGAYVLTRIETWAAPHRSWGPGYSLTPFTPEEPQANVCVYLPVVIRDW